MELPEVIYHVRRTTTTKAPYYGSKNRRIYAQRNHVSQFLQPNQKDHYVVHKLVPGGEWEDVTDEFVCEHIIMSCNVCGTMYDNDFSPPAECHNGPDDWDVAVQQRKRCDTHKRK